MSSEPAISSRPPLIVWDMVLTIFLLVVGIIVAFILSGLSLFLAFASDGCSAGCNSDAIAIGMGVAAFSPPVLFIVAIVVAIMRLVKRRIAFWVAVVGTLVSAIGFGVGVAIVFTSVGMQFNL